MFCKVCRVHSSAPLPSAPSPSPLRRASFKLETLTESATTPNPQWGVEAEATGTSWRARRAVDALRLPPEGEPGVVWSHPVDVHYAAKSLVGWPKMWFQVWHGQARAKDLAGYGFCHVPTSAGMRGGRVTWVPEGTTMEKLTSFFVGGRPRLKFEEVITPPATVSTQTRAGGVVKLNLGVCVKDFDKYNVAH